MSARRWRCPNPEHPGVLAPGKMRKDDTRRFCWPCSEERGRLVERTCAALEGKRAAAAERRRGAEAKARERARRRWTLDDGTDLQAALWRVAHLKVWGQQAGPLAASIARRAARSVEIVVGEPRGNHGRAWGSWRAHVHVRRDGGGLSAIKTIIHEVTHLAIDKTRIERKHGPHGRNFHSVLLAACQEYWPDLLALDREILDEYKRAGGAGAAYSMDSAISWALGELAKRPTSLRSAAYREATNG